jgi:hypothetical protein
MNDAELDNAIDLATQRTRDAEADLIEEGVESPKLVGKARRVNRRAEDLHDLTHEASEGLDAGDE